MEELVNMPLLEPHEIYYIKNRHKCSPDGMGYCSACDKDKPLGDFSKAKQTERGQRLHCRSCNSAAHAEYARKRPRELLSQKRRSRFNLTLEEYQALLDAQGGVCAICGQPETKVQHGHVRQLSIDHNHETGEIRGLLCFACNMGLGSFKDSLESLSNAIDYLMGTHR
jgi:hypothetical protein